MSASWQWRDGGGPPGRFGSELEQPFDGGSLVGLRSTVAAHADLFGLPPDAVGDLVLVAHELAANAVRHGGGGGTLRMWCTDTMICCEVADAGAGFSHPEPDRSRPPSLGATGGRGLWIVARLVAAMEVRTGPGGTVVTVQMPLQ